MKQDDTAEKSPRTRFANYAQRYVTSSSHSKGFDLDRLVEIAHPQRHWVMLDVATGGGHTALAFSPHVGWAIATDLTLEMLESARNHIISRPIQNVTFASADAESLPFGNESFDMVSCRIAPHHFQSVSCFIRESARVIKSGGLLIVQDHVLPKDTRTARYIDAFERLRDPSHNQAFSELEWIRMFEGAGFTVAHVEQIAKRHDFTSWVERQDCPPEVIERLRTMMKEAPRAASMWLQPDEMDSSQATFVNRHIIIAGVKSPKKSSIS